MKESKKLEKHEKIVYKQYGSFPGFYNFHFKILEHGEPKKGIGLSISFGVNELVKGMVPLDLLEQKLQDAAFSLDYYLRTHKSLVREYLRNSKI